MYIFGQHEILTAERFNVIKKRPSTFNCAFGVKFFAQIYSTGFWS
jgi:hypothetical protein